MSEPEKKYADITPPPVLRRPRVAPRPLGDLPARDSATVPPAPSVPGDAPAAKAPQHVVPRAEPLPPASRASKIVALPPDALAQKINATIIPADAKPTSVRVTQQHYTDVRVFALNANIRPMSKVLYALIKAHIPRGEALDAPLPAWLQEDGYDADTTRPMAVTLELDEDLKRAISDFELYQGVPLTRLAAGLIEWMLPRVSRLVPPRRRSRNRRGRSSQ